MQELSQVLDVVLETNRTLLTIMMMFASIVIALLGSVIVFVVGWQLRQDKQVASLTEKAGAHAKTIDHISYLLDKSVPELFRKWDKVICSLARRPDLADNDSVQLNIPKTEPKKDDTA